MSHGCTHQASSHLTGLHPRNSDEEVVESRQDPDALNAAVMIQRAEPCPLMQESLPAWGRQVSSTGLSLPGPSGDFG
jgi:hypothetical protein